MNRHTGNERTVGRRSFLTAGAASAVSLAAGTREADAADPRVPDDVLLRVGIVGCGPYSHVRSYGDVLLALDGRRPHKTCMRLTHIWGGDYSSSFKGEFVSSGAAESWIYNRSPEFFKSKRPDVVVVDEPADMLGAVDAVMVMDFDRSVELAEPFLREAMPVFVNRPFAATMEDGRRLLDMADRSGSAVFTGSLVPALFETQKLKAAVMRDSLYAFHADAVSDGFGRYVSHGLEFIHAIVGGGVRRVRLSGWNGSGGYDPESLPPVIIELEYDARPDAAPLRGTLLMRGKCPDDWWFKGYHDKGVIVEGVVPAHDGIPSDVGDDHWRLPFLGIMEQVFRTNVSPESREDILHKLAVMLASHKSAMEGGRWVALDEVGDHRMPSVLISRWDERL